MKTTQISILFSFAMVASASQSGKQYHNSFEVFSWSNHSPDECAICKHFEKISTGGRPKKRSREPGRLATTSTMSATDYIHSIAPSSYFPMNTKPAREVSQLESAAVVTAELVCKLYAKILDQPIQLIKCRSLVCLTCLCLVLDESGVLLGFN